MADGDTSIHGASDGGVAGVHPTEVEPRPNLVAPSTGSQFNVLKAALLPIACWRVDDVRFDFDSSFVLPEAKDEMALLAEMIDTQTDHAKKLKPPLSVFGHADPIGGDDYNKALSGRRSAAIYGMITRDTGLWEHLYSQPLGNDDWRKRSVPLMLGALGFDPGTTDDDLRAAIGAFRDAKGPSPGNTNDRPFRAVLFRAYMDLLCGDKLLLVKEDFLARGKDSGRKGDYQGCSRFNPVLLFSQSEFEAYERSPDKTARNTDDAPNRRVVIFLFRPGTRVDPNKWPCPSASAGPAACYTRFWSDGDHRRRYQALRRRYEDTNDTFACRFYDRLANDSPCEGLIPVNQVYRITLELGDIDRLFTPIGAKTPADTGVRQRLQAVGYLYERLDSANIAQLAQDAWDHFKTVEGQSVGTPFADDAAAVEHLQKLVRTLILDQEKLPAPGQFGKIRLPGTYCVTIPDYNAVFNNNTGPPVMPHPGPNSYHFQQELDVWNANLSLGLIPIVAKVETSRTGVWRPAPAGMKVHIQLIVPDALPAGNAVTPPALRNTSPPAGTIAVNLTSPGPPQTTTATNIALNSSPNAYVTLQRTPSSPPAADDPAVDNIASNVGGKRGNPVAGTQRLQNILEITTSHNGFHDHFQFTPAETGSHPNSVIATTNEHGQAAVIFMPTWMGGDRYKIRAFLDPVGGRSFNGDEEDAVKAETGTMVVWRILRIGQYLVWNYPTIPSPPPQWANLGGPLPLIDFQPTGDIATEYRKSWFDAFIAPSAQRPRPISQTEWRSAMQFAKSHATVAFIGKPYDLNALVPDTSSIPNVNNPSPGIILVLSAQDYDNAPKSTPAPPGGFQTNAQGDPNYANNIVRVQIAVMDEFMQFFTKNAFGGLTVIQAPSLGWISDNQFANFPVTYRSSGLAMSRRGAYLTFGQNIYATAGTPGGFPYSHNRNTMHEFGHCMYGFHQYTGSPGGPAIGFRPFTDDHDYHDLCVMGYQACPGEYCGRCLLNHAGWNVQAIAANGP